MDVDLEVGREPAQLALPVPEHRRRAHDQRRPAHVVAVVEQVGDHLHGLPEAHVVGEERPQAELARPRQPPQPDLLVRAQLALERLGRLERRDVLRAAKPGDELLELAGGIAHLDRHSAHLVAPGERRSERGHRRHRRAVERDRGQGLGAGEGAALERPPLPADPHERLRRSGERLKLLGADLAPAERCPQVVAHDPAERQRARGEVEVGSVVLQILLLDQLGRQLDRRARELERRGGQAQLDDPLLPQRHQPVGRARQRGEDPRRLLEERRIGRIGVQRPAGVRVGRRLEAEAERLERVVEPDERRSQAEVGRDGAEERLEHPEVDDVGVRLGRSHDARVAHRRRQRPGRGVDEPSHGVGGRLGGDLALLVADEDRVAGGRECGCEPPQVGDGAAAEDRLLDDPRHQPPCTHRGARRPIALGQEVGDGGQHLEAPHLDRAMAVPHGDALGEPPERVRQTHVAEQVGPAAGRERRHGVVAEQGLLDAPGDVRQLQRRPPGH